MRDTKNSRISAWLAPALIGVLVIGLLLGILLGRVSARTAVGDVLTSLSLFVLGLAAAAVLVAFGWLMGSRRAMGQASPARVVAPESPAETAAAPAPVVPTGETVGSASAMTAPGETVGVAPVMVAPVESRQTAVVPAPSGGQESVLAFGPHLALVSGSGKIGFRIHNAFGYRNLKVAVGLNPAWAARLATPKGREAAARETRTWFSRKESWALILFAAALVVYAITRFVNLTDFPIYFFTDEAIGPVLGTELVQRGFRDGQGNLFPTFFQNGLYWNLSLSVYLQAITATLLGKSIFVTRATSALISLSGAFAVGLILKWFLKVRVWWLGVLLLAVTPAWFLHSRTAFETVLMVSFYSWFLLFYLLYRYRSPRYIFPTLLFAAATFYSYSNGQAIIGLSGILFLISDFRYHLKNWRIGVQGLVLFAVLALPYLRFRWQHPDIIAYHLRILDSYWLQPIPLDSKIERFVSTYLYGLSPQYWFLPNEQDLIRHQMKEYGNIPLWMLPLFVIGLAACLRWLKSSAHRAILISLLVAPFGAALADIAVTRVLLFVVPAAILATLGVDWLIERIRQPRVQTVVVASAFALPALISLLMLNDALTNGPTWYDNYGLYGLQWGTRQLFQEAIPQYETQYPDSPIYVSHSWANGSDIFVRFFDIDPSRVHMETIDAWIAKKLDLDPNAIFIMAPEEYAKATSTPKFQNVELLGSIPYPDQRDGFYIVRLQYADNVDQIFAQEREAMRKLVVDHATIDGNPVTISHTQFDIGDVQAMLDSDPYTVARGIEINPLVLDFQFGKARSIRNLQAYFGKSDVHLTVQVYGANGEAPITYQQDYQFASSSSEFPAGPLAKMAFDGAPDLLSRVRMEVLYTNGDEHAHVHVFGIQFDNGQ